MKTSFIFYSQTLNLVKEEDVKTSLSEPQSPTKVKSGLQYTSRELELRDSSSILQQSSNSLSTDKSSPESPQHSSSSNHHPSPQPPSPQPKTTSNQAADRVRSVDIIILVLRKDVYQLVFLRYVNSFICFFLILDVKISETFELKHTRLVLL